MLKKILLSALLFVGVAGGELKGDLFNFDDIQFYIGAAGGVSSFSGNHRAHHSRFTHSTSLGGTNGLVGGVVGAQKTFCNDIYVAVQANALYNTFDRRINRIQTSSRHHRNRSSNNFQYGGDGRIGMNFCGTVLYVLGGVEAGSFRLNHTHRRVGSSAHHRSHTRTLWGPKVGGGVTFPITCQWNFNMEYSYTWFGDLRRCFNDDSGGSGSRHNKTINQNAVLFGLNYLF